MTIFNPDSWMDVFTIVAVTLLVAVPSWLAARNHSTLQKVDKSISNGHSSPIRLDLDDVRNTLAHIRSDLHNIYTELGDIRGEIREERKDRLALETRFEQSKKI